MKPIFCWRCCETVPMLDEAEFAEVNRLYSEGMQATQEFRIKHGLTLADSSIEERFRPVREAYEQMTGWKNMHHNAIMHHRISLQGAPCPKCNKPLRTPTASFCAACGHRVNP